MMKKGGKKKLRKRKGEIHHLLPSADKMEKILESSWRIVLPSSTSLQLQTYMDKNYSRAKLRNHRVHPQNKKK